MHLSSIFLTVLAASVIVTSMAAWGISYSTSHDRVVTMASDFTRLAQGNLESFDSFIADLLQENARLVGAILAQQRNSGINRTAQTQAEVALTIGSLVNYSTNSTEQTQQQMTKVVDTFASLMGTVVTDFRGVVAGYAAQVRADLAATGSATLNTVTGQIADVFKRIQQLSDFGMINLTRTMTDNPISLPDCTLLRVLCDFAAEIGYNTITFASATGRTYSCGMSDGASITVRNTDGALYNDTQVYWPPAYGSGTMLERCLSETPVVQDLALNCPTSIPRCYCGADARCQWWYQLLSNATDNYFTTEVLPDSYGDSTLTTFMPLLDFTATPAAFLGALELPIPMYSVQNQITNAVGYLNNNFYSVLLNDTGLSNLASVFQTCSPGDVQPGDPSLPAWSSLRSCDPGLRAVAEWVAGSRSVAQPGPLQFGDLVWDVTPVQLVTFAGFFIVASNITVLNAPIDASSARSTASLSDVRTELLHEVQANGAATRAYMTSAGSRSMTVIQAMQDHGLAEIQALENASLRDSEIQALTMASFQQSSISRGLQLTSQQTQQIEALKTNQLDAMSITAGWTIGVVFGILCGVLLASAWGTIRITLNLLNIIALMEAVADMKVEDLAVPQNSSVQEVARIQTAFQVLITRLAVYKSYIPAGLLERAELGSVASAGEELQADGRASDAGTDSSCDLPSGVPPQHLPKQTSHHTPRKGSGSVSGSRSSDHFQKASLINVRRSARKNVAAMAVNAMRFIETLGNASDGGFSGTIFNDYVTLVHESVAQHRGNIDCILGDQIFVTFNAHMPCGDSCGAALLSALDVRSQVLRTGDRIMLQMGVSFGTVFASSVGYARFKSMVTLGSPMQIASTLAHLPAVDSGTVLIDSAVEERAKFVYQLSPMELVHMPNLKSFSPAITKSQPVYIVHGKKVLQEDEWMYQIQEQGVSMDWAQVFDQLAAALTQQEGQHLLQQYLAAHPQDRLALRLSERFSLWIPGLGVPQ